MSWMQHQPALGDWYQHPAAQSLLANAQTRLGPLLAPVYGVRGVQVGQLDPAVSLLEGAGLMQTFVVDPRGAEVGADMVGDAQHLPLASSQFNLVFLPHTLDFAERPHQVLREAERLLNDDGYLLLMGFNLFSSLGARRLVRSWGGAVPWNGHWFTRGRVAEWLSVLNFQVVDVAGVGSRSTSLPPVGGLAEQLRGLREYYAPLYLVLARKRTLPLTLSVDRFAARRAQPAKVVSGYFNDPVRRARLQRRRQDRP